MQGEPLERRKELLERVVPDVDRGRVRRVEHIIGNGPEFYAEACRLKLEGIVSKQLGKPYASGRSRSWLKVKWPGWQPHGKHWR